MVPACSQRETPAAAWRMLDEQRRMERAASWKKRGGGGKKTRCLLKEDSARMGCHPWMLNKDVFSVAFRVRSASSPPSPPAGIGIGMLCVSTLVCLYYNVIIAWTFYYLGSSFQSPLPWSCDAVANAALCGNGTAGNGSGRVLSPSEIFWKYVRLHLSRLVQWPSLYSTGMTPALLCAASGCWVSPTARASTTRALCAGPWPCASWLLGSSSSCACSKASAAPAR